MTKVMKFWNVYNGRCEYVGNWKATSAAAALLAHKREYGEPRGPYSAELALDKLPT